MDTMILPGQTVFARWDDGYYYPAVIDELLEEDIIKITFLDGCPGFASKEQIVELQEALQIMQLQGNFKNQGLYFKGRLNTQEPMTMYYNDGDIEQIELKQLRGARPGEPVVWKQAAALAVAGAVVGLAIYGIRKAMKKSKNNRETCCNDKTL
ncbi:MAG: tudor domain-containing protein [Oscillospiraceae bacterium]|nr:tudor domain-containing protein [Oscillospiraceae bacterium]